MTVERVRPPQNDLFDHFPRKGHHPRFAEPHGHLFAHAGPFGACPSPSHASGGSLPLAGCLRSELFRHFLASRETTLVSLAGSVSIPSGITAPCGAFVR